MVKNIVFFNILLLFTYVNMAGVWMDLKTTPRNVKNQNSYDKDYICDIIIINHYSTSKAAIIKIGPV